MKTLIQADSLVKQYGSLIAVQEASFNVQAGEILALLGPNGAGKTTTIRMLASILAPTRGWARVAGFDTVREAAQVRRSVGMLTEHHGLYTRMRAQSYLAFYAQAYGMEKSLAQERMDALLARFELQEEALTLRLGQYSKGMRQKLAMVRALLHDPQVLLLDEPTSAMDPASSRLVRESIQGLRSSQRAIIVCTHNLAEAELLADRISIIRKGRIIANGSVEELKRMYLGPPIMELRLVGAVNGVRRHLPPGLKVCEVGLDWLRYEAPTPNEINPRVLESVARAGLTVITLSEVGRSLEEVYLQVVQQKADEVFSEEALL